MPQSTVLGPLPRHPRIVPEVLPVQPQIPMEIATIVAELAPLMAKRGEGAIVNVSTMVADYGAPGMSLYGSSKAAINLLTKAWAAEYGPNGVRVNAVSPGPTRTEGTAAMDEGLEQLAAQAPAGRPATADEIAEAIVFLATDRASYIQGAKLAVDGGRTAV